MTDTPRQRRSLSYEAYTECWYVPGETSIVDLIHPDDGLTLHLAENDAEVRARYPGALRMAFDEAWKRADAAGSERYRQDVTEISEAEFIDALNVLPPVGWTTRAGVESFRISERLWGDITVIYARLGARYFKLTDDIRLPATTIAARVAAYAAAHRSNASKALGVAPQRPTDDDRHPPGHEAAPRAPRPGEAS